MTNAVQLSVVVAYFGYMAGVLVLNGFVATRGQALAILFGTLSTLFIVAPLVVLKRHGLLSL